MEPTVDGWRDELHKYFRSIEKTSESAFKRIKRDRSRNNLPFDDAFVDFILKRISARITNVYTNLLSEDILEDEQYLLNQNVKHQNDGNVRGLGLSNTSVNTTLGQNNNQMSDKMVITTPANQLPSAVPLKREDTENSEQELRTHHSIRPELPGKVDVKMESKMDDPNKDTENMNTNDSKMVMQSPPTGAHRPKCDEPLENKTNSINHQPESIDLTMDEEDVVIILDNDQSVKGQTQSNVCRQTVLQAKSELNIVISQTKPLETDRNHEQQSTAIKLENADGSTSNDESFELTSMNAAKSAVADKQIAIAASSIRNFELNPRSKGVITVNVTKDGKQRRKGNTTERQMVSHLHENFNNPTKGIGNVAGPSKPAVQRRQMENHVEVVSKNLKKKRKLGDALDLKKRHKCKFCDYSTNNISHLTIHIRKHTGERPYECKICKKRFIHKKSVNRHMIQHGDIFQFQCSNCRRGFSRETSRKLHESHCNEKQFECYLCGKKCYHQRGNLEYHMRREHTGERPFSCSHCRKCFDHKSDQTRHEKRCH